MRVETFCSGRSWCGTDVGLVELDHAEVLLFEDGKFHLPEMELKDFYSYAGLHADTIEASTVTMLDLDADIGIFEWLTVLGYAAGGYGWSLDEENSVKFRSLGVVDRVFFMTPLSMPWSGRRIRTGFIRR